MASHIVVGVDVSAAATAAVEWADADAQRRELDLRIVHVCEQWPHSDGIEHCAGALEARRRPGTGAHRRCQGDDGAADGLGGLASALLGSVSHGALHHVTCPVAIVRPHAEEKP
jgi:nucleotide-binding universal stress UspA family protein